MSHRLAVEKAGDLERVGVLQFFGKLGLGKFWKQTGRAKRSMARLPTEVKRGSEAAG